MDKDARLGETPRRDPIDATHASSNAGRGFSPHPASDVSAMLALIERASRSLSEAGGSIDARNDEITHYVAELQKLTMQRDDAYEEAALTKTALQDARTRLVAAERSVRDAYQERQDLREHLASANSQIQRLTQAIGRFCGTIKPIADAKPTAEPIPAAA